MNIENLISKYKRAKLGEPSSVIPLGKISTEALNTVKKSLDSKYDLTDPKYATSEFVFYDTRRIVAKTKHMMTTKQLFTSLDFDYELFDIVSPIIREIQDQIGRFDASLVQIATLLPQQKLQWHVDTFLYQQFSNKIHIPLTTNDKAYYDVLVNGKVLRKNMGLGNFWNINNLDLHRSINLGDVPRSHLIIDFIQEDVLDVLDNSGINYYHHRLPEMSEKEKRQYAELDEFVKTLNR